MDVKKVLGLSQSEFMVARIGQLTAILCGFLLLPILPFVGAYLALAKLFSGE